MRAQLEAQDQGTSSEVALLREQVEQLQVELRDASVGGGASEREQGAGTDQLMRELHTQQDLCADLSSQLDEARRQANERIERSTPFLNMRSMLAKKNSVVRQLRDTLAQHGIYVDDVDAQDD